MYKRIVVKIGTSVLTEEGRLNARVMEGLVGEVAALRARDIEIILVTSGAVAAGKELLGELPDADAMTKKQTYAAVGQVSLMTHYAELFKARRMQCAQILVTKEDFRDRSHYANMRTCFYNLLRQGVVPIVNENDTISIHELVFTDNDELAGLIGSQLGCDAVLFLTGVEGVLSDRREVIPEIAEADIASFSSFISDAKSSGGRGGMRTKFSVAQKLMRHGITVHVLRGARPHVLVELVEGARIGTKFIPAKKVSAAKRRLSYSEGLAAGRVYIDEGAARALCSRSASLLPVGITKAEGEFKKGDVVELRNAAGERLGFGVAQYGSSQLMGHLGKKGGRAFVHYDYLALD